MTIADTVNAWFTDRLATGPIARNTEAYNQALAAKEELIAQLTDAAPVPATPSANSKAANAAARIAADAATLAADEVAAGQTAA